MNPTEQTQAHTNAMTRLNISHNAWCEIKSNAEGAVDDFFEDDGKTDADLWAFVERMEAPIITKQPTLDAIYAKYMKVVERLNSIRDSLHPEEQDGCYRAGEHSDGEVDIGYQNDLGVLWIIIQKIAIIMHNQVLGTDNQDLDISEEFVFPEVFDEFINCSDSLNLSYLDELSKELDQFFTSLDDNGFGLSSLMQDVQSDLRDILGNYWN